MEINNAVFGPFPKVAHSLHKKSANDGTLCKMNKKTGNLTISGYFSGASGDIGLATFDSGTNQIANQRSVCDLKRSCDRMSEK